MHRVTIIDKSLNKAIGEALVHFEEEFDRMTTQEEHIDLVPEEGFVEDTNNDNSKRFTCKQCSKVCKTDHSMKQHIGKMHKNKSIKRTAPKSDNFSKKRNLKPFREEEYDIEDDILHSTQLDPADEDTMKMDDYHFEEEMQLKDVDCTFKFNETLEVFLKKRQNSANVEADTENDDEEIYPDQDHNYLVTEDNGNQGDLVRAKNIALMIEIENKDLLLNERENELKDAQLKVSELASESHSLKDELHSKDEALNTATAHINTLEEKKKKLEAKLTEYTVTLKDLIKEKAEYEGKPNNKNVSAEVSNKEKELQKTIKEKNKLLKDSESAQKALAKKLSDIENSISDNKTSVDAKYKKVNDQLSSKNKEAKKANEETKKAEKRAKELLDTVSEKNKKISEMENTITRLGLLKDQAKEIVEKTVRKTSSSSKTEEIKKKRCRFDNTGTCKNRNCEDVHAKKTCQPFSKLGSCSMESSCDHRHPFGVCFDWQNHGSCYNGDSCRNRHPFEMAAPRAFPSDHSSFLGQGSPNGTHGDTDGWRGQPSQRSPGQVRHHDLRGMGRW